MHEQLTAPELGFMIGFGLEGFSDTDRRSSEQLSW